MFYEEERRTKPTQALKILVYRRDKGICRLCGEKVDPLDFDIGHNTAFARGGKLSLKNAILLHPRCNRSMQKLNLKEARTVLGMPETQEEQAKKILRSLGMNQLKYLAKQSFIKLKSRVEEGFFSTTVIQPSKRQYVNALAKALNVEEIKSKITSMPKPERKKKPAKKKSGFWDF